ncbi:MAG TPA: CoA transferase [Myxococcota bacterium]|nr:CoA transferase [Myxococcota bacterium]
MPLDFANGPLTGVRVLDLSRVIAGPYVGRLFADLGAEVIKVEPPEGDDARNIAPRHDRGQSWLLHFSNVGKRSIALDLGKPGAADVILGFARISDAVIENFRPGVAERLGLGWTAIRAQNPRAVLLSVNGFGSGSAWSDRRAYAPIVHAITGLLRDRGQTAQTPAQPRIAYSDVLTALHASVALLAALRMAEATGQGQHVEVPMFDATLASHSEAGNVLIEPPDDRVMNPIFDAGAHGWIAVGGAAQHVWVSLATAFAKELPDPAAKGADLGTKAALRHQAVADFLAAQPSLEAALERLARAKLAAAPVVTPKEALLGELARERALLVPVDDRKGGTRPVVRSPARFSATRNEVRGPAPLPGEHGAELLRELLGFDDARIRALIESGALLFPEGAPADA